jgi:hypothetical protein
MKELQRKRDGRIILRDLVIFQIKLFLDGVKDIVLMPLSIGAAALDVLAPTGKRGRRFYAVMRAGEKYDRWLNLFGASQTASESAEGLFGVSRAGSDTLLGKLEEYVLGHAETDDADSPRSGGDPARESGSGSADTNEGPTGANQRSHARAAH